MLIRLPLRPSKILGLVYHSLFSYGKSYHCEKMSQPRIHLKIPSPNTDGNAECKNAYANDVELHDYHYNVNRQSAIVSWIIVHGLAIICGRTHSHQSTASD